LTGTLAGQIVMEGFLRIRLRPWVRRLITRLLAAGPVLLVVWLLGDDMIGRLLIFSQVILSLQLGFAVIPLIYANQSSTMGVWKLGGAVRLLAWVIVSVIVALNGWLVVEELGGIDYATSSWGWIIVVFSLATTGFLIYLILQPRIDPTPIGGWDTDAGKVHPGAQTATDQLVFSGESDLPRRMMVALDFGGREAEFLQQILRLVPSAKELILVHVTESPSLLSLKQADSDPEFKEDENLLSVFADALRRHDYHVVTEHGIGRAAEQITRVAEEYRPDLLAIGTHGHRGLVDVALGATADRVRHQVACPVLLIPLNEP